MFVGKSDLGDPASTDWIKRSLACLVFLCLDMYKVKTFESNINAIVLKSNQLTYVYDSIGHFR